MDTQQLVAPTVETTHSNTPQQPLPMALGTTAHGIGCILMTEPRPAAPTLQPRALLGFSPPAWHLLAAAGQPTHCYFWALAQEDALTTATRPWGAGDGQ